MAKEARGWAKTPQIQRPVLLPRGPNRSLKNFIKHQPHCCSNCPDSMPSCPSEFHLLRCCRFNMWLSGSFSANQSCYTVQTSVTAATHLPPSLGPQLHPTCLTAHLVYFHGFLTPVYFTARAQTTQELNWCSSSSSNSSILKELPSQRGEMKDLEKKLNGLENENLFG